MCRAAAVPIAAGYASSIASDLHVTYWRIEMARERDCTSPSYPKGPCPESEVRAYRNASGSMTAYCGFCGRPLGRYEWPREAV